MAVYIVTYDLNREQVRPDILAEIKKGDWAQLSESSYAINTTASADAVFKSLRKYIDDNDTLYVINLTRPYAGRGAKEVNDWLEENLP